MTAQKETAFIRIKDYFINVSTISRVKFGKNTLSIYFDGKENGLRFSTKSSEDRKIPEGSIKELKEFFTTQSSLRVL